MELQGLVFEFFWIRDKYIEKKVLCCLSNWISINHCLFAPCYTINLEKKIDYNALCHMSIWVGRNEEEIERESGKPEIGNSMVTDLVTDMVTNLSGLNKKSLLFYLWGVLNIKCLSQTVKGLFPYHFHSKIQLAQCGRQTR